MILIIKVSGASVRHVSHLYNNTGLKDVEVGLDGNLTVLSKYVQIVVRVDMLSVGK